MSNDGMDRQDVHAIVDLLELPELETLVVKWHHDRNLIKGSSDKDQMMKLIQEAGELSDSLCHQESPIDDLGDIIVVLLNIAERHGLTLTDCVRHAYKDIMHRKGRMVDGIFIKSDDLGDEPPLPKPTFEWQQWHGGNRPTLLNTLVEVKLRSGSTSSPLRAGALHWGHRDTDDDIVEFRVVPHG